ncbi:UvrB/UvrC motif-containing protein, partial [Pseudomonas syringae]|uniref:UvrB/UvrC motif-containing protein n=1 Tax=Pseudomonas syringae TaxID=317 RepID=UPI001F506C44
MTPNAPVNSDPEPVLASELPARYVVAVRALCEFTAKVGDLDLRFTPSPTAQEGIAGHRTVATRRGADYQAELSLSGDYRELTVRGRADGYDASRNQLEEVKTYRGELDAMPANHRQLHWAQVKVYGWLLCQRLQLESVTLALVYFNIVSEQETLIREPFSAAALQAFFERQCTIFLGWAQQELAHTQALHATLGRLKFPHASFRTGQRVLAESVYKTVSTGCCLMAQAPTGIGKTVGTLFPLLKAAPGQKLDKIFFLTAKTPGRRLALDALEVIKNRTRPCLQYQIKRCKGPCVGLVEPEVYAEDVRHSVMFLEGRSNALSDELNASMEKAAMALDFERAAELRDQVALLRRVQDQQSMDGGTGDVDVVAAFVNPGGACVH